MTTNVSFKEIKEFKDTLSNGSHLFVCCLCGHTVTFCLMCREFFFSSFFCETVLWQARRELDIWNRNKGGKEEQKCAQKPL